MNLELSGVFQTWAINLTVPIVSLALKEGYVYYLDYSIPLDKIIKKIPIDNLENQLIALTVIGNDSRSKYYKLPEGYISIHYTDKKITGASGFFLSEEKLNSFKELLDKSLEDNIINANIVPVTFWFHTKDGAKSYIKNIEVLTWNSIKENYSPSIIPLLDSLVQAKLANTNGNLILLHGSVGLGKTFFIRSLLQEWKNQIQGNYIIDPDSLFNQSDFLVSILKEELANANKFKLLILEDTGEMLTKDAKQIMGQALARILNTADGILGQGSKVKILISTNEEITSLNAAVSRPGRCLAKIQFPKFTNAEAREWLDKKEFIGEFKEGQTSISELYDLLSQQSQIKTLNKTVIGFNK